MNKTIVVFGSSTGTCEAIAEKIAQKLGCEAINVQDLTAEVVDDKTDARIEAWIAAISPNL